MNDVRLRLILSNLRGAGNVGSIMRTANACGVELIYACGDTPYPAITDDARPPHVISSNTRAIAKTALGAQHTTPILHVSDTARAMRKARHDGFKIIVIEQAEGSLNLYDFAPQGRLTIVMGNEISGISPPDAQLADHILEIPMVGSKESLNVAVATAVALYQLTFGHT